MHILRAPVKFLLPSFVLLVIFSALTNSVWSWIATLIWIIAFAPSFWIKLRTKSYTAMGSLAFSAVALVVWGIPFIIRNAGQRLSLFDNDNVYATELALHFANDNAKLWETWEATPATLVMPRVLGAFEGRLIGFFGGDISADSIVNVHALFSLLILAISMGSLGAVFGYFYSLQELPVPNQRWGFIVLATIAGAFISVGWVGQEFTFGAMHFLLGVAICGTLLVLPTSRSTELLAIAVCGLGTLLIWPLLLPLAFAILIGKFVVLSRFIENLRFPTKPILFLASGIAVGLPFAFSNFGSRGVEGTFSGAGPCDWCYGGAASPVLVIAALITALVLGPLTHVLSIQRSISYVAILLLPSLLGLVILKYLGTGNDGYYLGRVLGATSLFAMLPLISLLSFITVGYLQGQERTRRLVIVNQFALALSLVAVTAFYYPRAPMILHNASESHSALISAVEATNRFDPSYTPFLDGELLLNSLQLKDSESRVVLPWTESCVKPGSSNYYLRWRAVFLNSVKRTINDETNWAALPCPSQLELRAAKPPGKSLVLYVDQ